MIIKFEIVPNQLGPGQVHVHAQLLVESCSSFVGIARQLVERKPNLGQHRPQVLPRLPPMRPLRAELDQTQASVDQTRNSFDRCRETR